MTEALFSPGYRALVIGASGAIGSAFVRAFEADALCAHVAQVSRTQAGQVGHGGFDLTDAASIAAQAAACQPHGPYQVIVDATGALTIDGVAPEKSLRALQPETLARAFQVNAIGPALVLQQFAPLFASGPGVYAKLSARVGSIADNRKGGWYGYRASKAALNMLLQTAAIELQRRQPALRVVALQPGTVRSHLSQPFSAAVPELLEPDASVAGMLAALRQLPLAAGAQFIDHRGNTVPW